MSADEDQATTPRRTRKRKDNDHALVSAARAQRFALARADNWGMKDGHGGLALLARAVVIGSLPMQATRSRELIRVQRLGANSSLYVKLAVSGNGVMPFGNDALVAHFMAEKALLLARQGARKCAALEERLAACSNLDEHRRVEAELTEARDSICLGYFPWEYAEEYLEYRGLSDGAKNYRDLRSAVERLHALDIVLHHTEQGVLTRKRMPFIEASRLPASINPRVERRQLRLQGQALGVQLHRELVLDGMKHPVVIPRDVIREYASQPLLWRLLTVLSLRIIGTRSESVIPWSDLRDLLGVSPERQARDVRAAVRKALETIQREVWRDLAAWTDNIGLRIAPCPPLVARTNDTPAPLGALAAARYLY